MTATAALHMTGTQELAVRCEATEIQLVNGRGKGKLKPRSGSCIKTEPLGQALAPKVERCDPFCSLCICAVADKIISQTF
jgi:hypothetical protein